MLPALLRLFSWVVLCVGGSSCLVARHPAYWHYSRIPVNRALQPIIKLELQKATLPLGILLLLWETGSKRYQLSLNFVTSTAQYQQFDSIQYQIRTDEDQLLATGSLPFGEQKLYTFPFDPRLPSSRESYLLRCATPAHISMKKQRHALKGTFLLYAVDQTGQPARVRLDTVSLRYQKATLGSFF
jgi:hypothetical protein